MEGLSRGGVVFSPVLPRVADGTQPRNLAATDQDLMRLIGDVLRVELETAYYRQQTESATAA
jgi:hypothetical protein